MSVQPNAYASSRTSKSDVEAPTDPTEPLDSTKRNHKSNIIWFLVGASLLQLFTFMALLVLMIVQANAFGAGFTRSTQLQDWKGQIQWLDEVLTMSARLATLTGNTSWVDRYNAHVGTLDEVFVLTLDNLDAASRNKFDSLTFSANEKLINWEDLALKAVSAGKPEEGRQYMFGPAYDEQKRIYHQGLDVIRTSVEDITNQTLVFMTNFTIAILLLLGFTTPVVVTISLLSYRQQRIQADIMRRENELSEELLFNMLPKHISLKLKSKLEKRVQGARQKSDAVTRVLELTEQHPAATVCFMDMVGFTAMSAARAALDIVKTLNAVFSLIDRMAKERCITKIKTIGDCYMAASGLEATESKPELQMVRFAVSVLLDLENVESYADEVLMRCGIHTGPVVSAVLGTDKFLYDIFGDTVNVASRMESNGQAGKIHVLCELMERNRPYLCDEVDVGEPREVTLKGKGQVRGCLLTPKG